MTPSVPSAAGHGGSLSSLSRVTIAAEVSSNLPPELLQSMAVGTGVNLDYHVSSTPAKSQVYSMTFVGHSPRICFFFK